MKKLRKIYKEITRNINYNQKRLELYTNKKRKKKSQFKEENKIYFLKKNLGNLRSSRKLNHKKVSLFTIKKKKVK